MANSDHEDLEVSTSTSIADAAAEWRWTEQVPNWCKNPRENRRHRRYTVSHVAPPAPPSTPTLLTNGSIGMGSSNPSTTVTPDNNRLKSLIYLASSRNLRRQSRCSDAELAELFNVVSITNRLTTTTNNNHIGSGLRSRTNKQLAERGIRNASRAISKLNGATKIFKIHRNPKEFLREPDEDSVSAPEEYDTEEEESRYRPLWRYKSCRRMLQTRRERRLARFEHQERMETIVDNFDTAMNFNNA